MYTPCPDDPEGRAQLNVRIPVELLRAVKVNAALRGQELNDIVRELLAGWVKRNKES